MGFKLGVTLFSVVFITIATSVFAMRGFYIGRFQPYHNGHHHIINKIADEVDELVVGIGSAGDSHSPRNPFTAGERVMMVSNSVSEIDLITYVIPIEDINRNAVWINHILSMSPGFDLVYSSNPLVLQLFSEAGIEVRKLPLYRRGILSGTEVRQRMFNGDNWQKLVPTPVVDVVSEISGIRRLRQINSTDAPHVNCSENTIPRNVE